MYAPGSARRHPRRAVGDFRPDASLERGPRVEGVVAAAETLLLAERASSSLSAVPFTALAPLLPRLPSFSLLLSLPHSRAQPRRPARSRTSQQTLSDTTRAAWRPGCCCSAQPAVLDSTSDLSRRSSRRTPSTPACLPGSSAPELPSLRSQASRGSWSRLGRSRGTASFSRWARTRRRRAG